MKKSFYIVILISVLGFISCKKEVENEKVSNPNNDITKLKNDSINSVAKKNIKLTEVKFKELEYDFGTIKQGEKVEHIFEFTNTGKNNLIITKAYSSCGCTVPDYPKRPIKPGESSQLKVIFNSAGKRNKQKKTITILANIKEKRAQLKIRAEIEVDKNQKEEYNFKKNK